MRAVRISGVSRLHIPRMTLPKKHDELLVKVHSFGVNRPDYLQYTGKYPPRPGTTDILGLELSGHAVELNDVAELTHGRNALESRLYGQHGIASDENEMQSAQNKALTGQEGLCALVSGGAFAEYCVVKRGHCLPIPKGMDIASAAGLPECVFTVWKNLFSSQGPESLKGKSVLIHGGASGIGSTAIAMAKCFGASLVQTTAGSKEKCKECAEVYGADNVLNYKEDRWWDKMEKADVILDMVGGSYLNKNIRLLRDNGKLVIIGFMEGSKSTVDMTRVLLKSLVITGSVLRSAPDDLKEKLRDEILEHVWPRIESHDLRIPFVAKQYSGLESYSNAFEDMETGKYPGKLIVSLKDT